ncbi:NAD(P)H-binding protein [Vibrio tritonius]|uniref:NAD(P)H-binding protein n=1 Tax=Vibrio tritonius TaxID=1435069 RepID=UPI00315D98E9
MINKDFPLANDSDFYVMIAGASGLVGSQVLKHLLNQCHLGGVYTMVRQPLGQQHPKLVQVLDGQLSVFPENAKGKVRYGVIALGTTLKQAGSKEALKNVDLDLVVEIATRMKAYGITHVAVVSSFGANPKSHSHYLCCKGVMEHKLMRLGFEHLLIMRPGPLVGERQEIRPGEIWFQRLMKVGQYALFGQLRNIIPIAAQDVAKTLLKTLFETNEQKVTILNSVDMLQRLNKPLKNK